MLKFKYNYQENTLAYQKPGTNGLWYQIDLEQQFTGSFGSFGFNLTEGWMTFTIQANKIRVFYKQMASFWADLEKPSSLTYYHKDLPKKYPVIFTFNRKRRNS